jgi:phosphate transport system substrate-binding protein
MLSRKTIAYAAVTAVVLAAGVAPLAAQSLTGAGATFPNPIYGKWFSEYNKKTGIQISYNSLGSGAGILQFTQNTVDFGASDGPMNDTQVAAVQGAVIHFPTVIGADVVTYNLPAVGATPLKFDGLVLADIFLGKITKWNDKRIVALNPGVKLTGDDIIVVHRSEGSGTTYIWVDYLSTMSPEWKIKVGKANSVNWPVGLGGSGNEGVTQQVKQTEGSIAYVEWTYAVENKLPVALIKNAAGNFISPSIETLTNAAASAKFEKNTDFRVSIVNAPGAQAYPITSFTWLLIRPDTKDPAKAKAIKGFLTWMLTPEAQDMAKALLYAPLPAAVVALEKDRIKTLTSGGKPIM